PAAGTGADAPGVGKRPEISPTSENKAGMPGGGLPASFLNRHADKPGRFPSVDQEKRPSRNGIVKRLSWPSRSKKRNAGRSGKRKRRLYPGRRRRKGKTPTSPACDRDRKSLSSKTCQTSCDSARLSSRLHGGPPRSRGQRRTFRKGSQPIRPATLPPRRSSGGRWRNKGSRSPSTTSA